MYGDNWDNGVDMVAVRRAATDPGPCPELTDDEMRSAVQLMTENGMSLKAISLRLGTYERKVEKLRDEKGVQPCSG
ncbi:hypothetical protein OV450_1458 [Actinobacteria bacterium OV450]|nr:hypothetical protein OV450_1458 [Actinobacteria bacterium OV450]